jgi:hypothetical protein
MIPILFLLNSQKNDGPGFEPDPDMLWIGLLFGLVVAAVIILPSYLTGP